MNTDDPKPVPEPIKNPEPSLGSSSAAPSKIYPSEQPDRHSFEKMQTENKGKTDQKDKDYHQKESVEEKVRETLRNFRKSKKVDDIYVYAKDNKEQTITYTLLVVGLLLMLLAYPSIFGQLIVGLVAGYHYANAIMSYLRRIGYLFSGPEQLTNIVLTALVIALFISAPGIVIGALVAVGCKEAFIRS
ncbi:MAG: hypothetical protein H0V82_05715 [Candidatus Protochlamydia sp.]|nr:hypothetical protein [Candidatus Protochlamydia sp.]